MSSPNNPKDQNNLMFAVALSILVLMGWQYFFARPEIQHQQAQQEFNKKLEAQNKGTSSSESPPNVANAPAVQTPSTETPAVGQQSTAAPLSREEALKSSARVQIRRRLSKAPSILTAAASTISCCRNITTPLTPIART